MSDVLKFTLDNTTERAPTEATQRTILGEACCCSVNGVNLNFIFQIHATFQNSSGPNNWTERELALKGLELAAELIVRSGSLNPRQDVMVRWDERNGSRTKTSDDVIKSIDTHLAHSLSALSDIYTKEKAEFERSVKWLREGRGGYHFSKFETLHHMRVIVTRMRDTRSLFMGANLAEHAGKIERATWKLVERTNPKHPGYIQAQTTLLDSLSRANYRMT